MKKTIGIVFKILLLVVVVLWVGLIVTEYYRYQNNDPMLVVIKSETLTYDDGLVFVNYGLGYKSITYNRTSLPGREFGHIFIRVREKMPSR